MTSLQLPFRPRRIVVGANAHAEIAASLRRQRPELETRSARLADLAAGDLAWGEAYLGFKRPPAASAMGSVRWVHCTGAGVDAWLTPVELDREILLTRTPESFGPAIAEWAVARIFAFQQQLGELADAQRAHRWVPREIAPVAGTRALVVGTGDVGSTVAAKLAALGCAVSGVSRTGRLDHPVLGVVQPVSALDRLVGEAHWIVLAIPDTPATRGLFSREAMACCKGAVLLNAGRGSVVDEGSLPEAIERGWLRGAALDVFAAEPLPESSPLWSHPRVMISPHSSGPTTVEGAVRGFIECLESLEQGRMPRWVVDRDRGY